MEYYNPNELYHYGVPGMRWGHRKSASVTSTRNNWKKAKKESRQHAIKKAFSAHTYTPGAKNLAKRKADEAKTKKLKNKQEKAAFKAIDAQAKYAYDKTYNKYKKKNYDESIARRKAEKASMKVHERAMEKGKGGLPGSVADEDSGGASTRYHNHLVKAKGKKYAERVEKRYGNKLTSEIVGNTAIILGMLYLRTH